MKKVISYFIKYHVAVNVIIIAVIFFGILGIFSMKSSFFPLTDSRFINISVVYPGASPQEMEEGVVLKIEDNLKGIVGIDRVTSVSRENSASISVETLVDSDIDVVLAEVKNAVDRVPSFPSGMEPPVIAKVEAIAPTINFTVSGTDLPLTTLKKYARDVENDLRAMPGISQISLTGFPDEEIEIAVREIDLRAFDLTFADVAQAVQGSNLLISGGNIKTDYEDYLIRARNRQYYGEDLHNLIVKADQSGNVIYLKDVATVRDRWNENPDRLFFNDEVAISIQVNNTNSEDMIASADAINIYIEKFNATHDNVQLNVASDRSIVLKQRTDLLTENAFVGILLVLLFLSLFLNVRLAFWVAAGLPIAFLGMFIFAANLGVTINVLSLFGMIIVIGILVDDGIVIGENIYHHYEKGKSPVQAAIDGTMEVIPPIMSAILTTMLAFSIFFFLQGGIGDFFKEVSTVVILTLAVSLVEALIILPAHIAHSKALVRNRKKPTSGLFYIFNQINVKADQFLVFCRDRIYGPYLKFFLKNRFLGLAIPFAMLIFSIGGISSRVVRTSFFPNMASDRVDISLAMPQGTNERITDSIISSIEEAAWLVGNEYTEKQTGNTPVIENIIKRIGPGSSNASLTINLLPGEYRDFASGDITNAIRDKAGVIYGAESLTFGSGMNFGGSPVAVSLLGNNIEELKAAKIELKSALVSNPILKDVSDTDPAGIKEVRIKLKNDAYILGLTLQSVMNQVRSGFFGFQAQRFQRGQDEIKVWVRYEKEDRSSIRNLDDMWISTPTGNKVPFSEIATYDIARGDVAINHLEGRREIQITADMANPKESATDVMADIKDNVLPSILAKYPSVQPSFEGQNREAAKTINSATRVGGIVLVLIYCVIAFTFRSYSQPLLLLIMVPFSLIGIVWGHYIHGFSINILSWLGIIALVGIMVNDGLVLVGKFNSYLKQGMKFNDAMYEAGKSRFRAIFLTSLTTVAGLMPLLLEKSRQAQFLKPMAISISYGIMIATFLTLLMLPLLLSINNSLTVRIKWLITGRMASKEEVTRAVKELKLEENENK
ncbi:efflux RND transporter permease subunit [Lutimonas zeaxanthinifaciens]|uniref:efflux RND transporter permease subunit n=1 Tax=Lutimonas zeaxanthinifaciens TaxID=3060215 RepID=UPI00265C9A59|nr:efflux RND transporter permease subunit [Lutimonas sp. YSD2104]WKK67262.1 efflux RND transporter permease subunit [Lutimonas sp. YSD2104]